MNEELSYAEMLEIPVETVTVSRKEKRKRLKEEPDLEQQLVEKVNSRMEEDDPLYAESTEIEREAPKKSRRPKLTRGILIGEIVAVCALCAVIFLTNLFMTDSAINTFVRNLFQGNAQTADTRTYSDFKLSPVVNATANAELTVSDTGILSFTAACSVYSPCDGKVKSVNGDSESGYTVEIQHSDSFSTIISGLDTVYVGENDAVYSNIPVAYTDGEGSVRVMFYSNNTLLNCYSLNEGGLAWS